MTFWAIVTRDMVTDDGGYSTNLSHENKVKIITDTRDSVVLDYVAGYLSGAEGELKSIHKVDTLTNMCTPYEVELRSNKLALQCMEVA